MQERPGFVGGSGVEGKGAGDAAELEITSGLVIDMKHIHPGLCRVR